MKKIIILLFAGFIGLAAHTAPTVSDVVAKQRYPWNGLVDITCRVSGITGTRNKFYVEAVFPDSGKIKKVVRGITLTFNFFFFFSFACKQQSKMLCP